jgi:hypothetical protein
MSIDSGPTIDLQESSRTKPAVPETQGSSRTSGSASTPADRLAAAIATLAPASVELTGDGADLVDALSVRGIAVIRSDEAHAPAAELAVVHADAQRVDEALAKINAEVGRVLLWHEGDIASAAWMTVAASAGYFRTAAVVPHVEGATCVLLEAGQPSVSDVVARYETLLAERQELEAELRNLRHQLLTGRDHAIGAEAEIAQLRAGRQDLEDGVKELLATTTWRVGAKIVGPLARVRRPFRR